MKLSNISIILSVFILLIIINISLYKFEYIKSEELKRKYSEKVELSLEAAISFINEDCDDKSINLLADNNIEEADVNKELVLEKFLEVLNLNFNSKSMSMYVPVFIVLENDGMYVNKFEIETNNRMWSDKIPYNIIDENKYYKFNLNSKYNEENIGMQQLKKIAIKQSIDTQLKMNEFLIDIPIDDMTFYNSISSKSIIAVIKGIPLLGLNTYDVIRMKGYNVKSKGKYILDNNDRYYKVKVDDIKEGYSKEIFDTKIEATNKGYLPLLY